jgi:hypothetical protein
MSEETKHDEGYAVTRRAGDAVAITPQGGIGFKTLADMLDFGNVVSKSGFAPKGMEKPESIAIAVQHGLELGLAPMQALQSIAVINGRPGIYGDVALALVRSSGKCEAYTQEMVKGKGEDDSGARVTSKRIGAAEAIVTTFTVADAKRAGLWGKAGPWTQYPARMLVWRARGFNLRDNFGDVLRGLKTVEELQDIPADGDPINKARPVRGKASSPLAAVVVPTDTANAHDGAETAQQPATDDLSDLPL